MILTAEEIEEGAKRLVTSAKGDWEKATEAQRRSYRAIVKDLAAQVESEHAPEAVAVFLQWMEDPKR